MEKRFDFNKLYELEDKCSEAKKNYYDYKKNFVKLFKSNPNWREFLKHYCTIDDKEECYVDDHAVDIAIIRGTKPNTIIIEWDNFCWGDYGEQFKTRELSIELIEKFLYNENFFDSLYARLDRIKKHREETIRKEREERERKQYEILKAKYEK